MKSFCAPVLLAIVAVAAVEGTTATGARGLSLAAGSGAILAGGKMNQDPKSKEMMAVAAAAAQEISNMANSPYHKKLIRVTQAWSQVVAGIKYGLEMDIGPTKCLKSASAGKDVAAECEVDEAGTVEHCRVEILSQPWVTAKMQVLDFECHEK